MKVYLVQHEYEKNGNDNLKFVGIFSDFEKAQDVVQQLKNLPGFKDWPDGFEIGEYDLDEFFWKEGFGPSEKLLRMIDEAD